MSQAAAERYPEADVAHRGSSGAKHETGHMAEPAQRIDGEGQSAAPAIEDRTALGILGPEQRLRFWARARHVLGELLSAGPPSEGQQMIAALNAAEKREDSVLAFVPLAGLWLIERSKHHSRREKQTLTALSLGLSLVIVAVVWSLMPSDADRLATLRERMQHEMRVLDDVAERHRREHGSYPDAATWKWFAAQADGRFFDPWGRPYRYEPRVDGFTLKTLGRDGREGGIATDADITVERLRHGR
jgi:hypothetical protein